MKSLAKGVYDPKAFFLHAASLGQTFVHCPIFLVAATRRCTARVSVQLWLIDLSVQLPVIALVGNYPTNKLIGRRLLSRRKVNALPIRFLSGTMEYYPSFRKAMFHPEVDSYALLTRLPLEPCGSRSTCMPKARRQRSSWTRIKSSKIHSASSCTRRYGTSPSILY